MAELKLIYDDGFGKKTERTITSFRDPRNDYSDCQDEPTWPAILKEMWDFTNDLGFIINEDQQYIIDQFLERGDLDLDEFLDEGPTNEEPSDEDLCEGRECDGECCKCGLKETCKAKNSDECPMSMDKAYDEMAESGVITQADKAEIRESFDKPKEDCTPQPDSLLPLPIGQKPRFVYLKDQQVIVDTKESVEKAEPMEALDEPQVRVNNGLDSWLENLDEKSAETFLNMCNLGKKS